MKTTKSCPKCHETISLDARACACGWQAKQTAADAAAALHALKPKCARCSEIAMVRDGDAELCVDCYSAVAGERARASILAQGVDLSRKDGESIDAYRKRCIGWMRDNLRMKRA